MKYFGHWRTCSNPTFQKDFRLLPLAPYQALIPPLTFSVLSVFLSFLPLISSSMTATAGLLDIILIALQITKFMCSLCPFSPTKVDDNTEESDESCALAFCASFQFTESLGLRSGSCWFDSICGTWSTQREVSLKRNAVTGCLFRAVMRLSR